jgi:hypothetical protein
MAQRHKFKIVSYIVTALTLIIAAIMFSGFGLLAYWNLQSSDNAYVVLNPNKHYAYLSYYNSIRVYREFEIRRPLEITITRELRQMRDDGVVVRIELESTHAFYDAPGIHKVERGVNIPSNIQGKWLVIDKLCWHVNPIRNACVDLPTISLDA